MDDISTKTKIGCSIALVLVVLALLIGGIYTLVNLKHTDAGYVGIVVNYGNTTSGKPQVVVVPTSTYWWINSAAGQTFTEYPVQQQTLAMLYAGNEGEVPGNDSVLCQDASGVSISIDVTAFFQVDARHASTLYFLRPNMPLTGSFNNDIESTLVRPLIKNAITLACASYQWDAIGSQKEALIAKAEQLIIPELAQDGILMAPNNLFIGEIHYSAQQEQAINAKAVAQQQAQQAQYLQQEAQYKAAAEITAAQGEAKSIGIVNAALANSPNYLRYLMIKEWDGKLPTTVVGGSNPIITGFMQP